MLISAQLRFTLKLCGLWFVVKALNCLIQWSDVQHGSLHLNATRVFTGSSEHEPLHVRQPEPERRPAALIGTSGNVCKVCAFETDTAHKVQLT